MSADVADPTRTARSPLMRVLPVVVLLAIPVAAVLLATGPVGDPDTFWHIKAGQYLWDTWRFVGADPWGHFTSNEWILHEWLPELALAGAYAVSGFAGVAWVWAAGVIAVSLAIFATCRRQGSLVLALLGTLGGVLGTGMSLSPRPQLVTFGLLAVTTGAWLGTLRDHRPRWWLVGVGWLWACSHGMWVAGPLLGLVVVVGMALDGAPWATVRRLAAVPLLSVVVAALTPVGPRLLLTPFGVSGYAKYVSEWDPPVITTPSVAVTLVVLVAVLLIWLRGRSARPVGWAWVGMWAMALGWTLLYARSVALGAVIGAPLLVDVASRALREDTNANGSVRREWLAIGGSAVACLVVSALVLPHTAAVPTRVPVGLDSTLDVIPSGAVVFDEYDLGGWLLLRHPQLAPVVDGRTELYSLPYLDAYVAARGAQRGWEGFVERTGATYALLPEDSPLGDALVHESGWGRAGVDAGYILLRAP